MVSAPVDQVIQTDDFDKEHLEQIAGNVSLATNDKTGVPNIQPAIEQEVLDDQTKKQVENFEEKEQEQQEDKASKLSYFIPALQKRVKTTRAVNFLGKKMEWLNKKTGVDVGLK